MLQVIFISLLIYRSYEGLFCLLIPGAGITLSKKNRCCLDIPYFSNNKKNIIFLFVVFSPEEIFVLDTMMICCVYININGDLIRFLLSNMRQKLLH